MNIKEINEEIRTQEHYIAVYDELIAVLASALDGETSIPVANMDELVPTMFIDVVKDHLSGIRTEHKERVSELENAEIFYEGQDSSTDSSGPFKIGRT
jgi:hypothetical protein